MVDLNGKKILVTGGCGFIGSNFIEYVNGNYQNVKIFNIDKMGVGAREDEILPIVEPFHMIPGGYCETENGNYYQVNKIDLREFDHRIDPFDYVFHFAAESHVDRSINSPISFIENNVLGITRLLDWVKENSPDAKVINVSCYDEETKALTDRGILSYSQIKIGDKVLSLNEKREIEWKEVEKVIIQDYDGKMLHFKSPRNDLLVTPNHRMYYTDSDDSELYYESAENMISDKKIKYFPRGNLRNNADFTEKDWAKWYLFGIYVGDGCSDIVDKISESKSKLNKENYLKKCRGSNGQFIKYEASPEEDGYQEFLTQKGRRIFIHVPTGDKAREKTERALDILGISWTSIQKTETYDYIYTSDEWLYDSVQCFGKFAKEKHIPWNIINDLSYEEAESLFYGLIDSDGSYRNGHPWVLNTSSDRLADNALYLGNMLGFSPRISKINKTSYIEGRKIEGDVNCVYFRKSKIGINHVFEKVDYNGKVWCLKVKDNKNFITVRNGITHLSGNTDEVYGHLGEMDEPFTENSPLDPRSPYSASKAAADLVANSYVKTFGLDVITTRCCNNYGPHQFDEKFIPTIVRSLMQGKKIPVYGNGNNIREWIHVEDHIKSILEVAQWNQPGEVYNIGGGFEASNLDMVAEILEVLDPDCEEFYEHIEFVEDRKGHDFRYAIKSVNYKREFKLRNFYEALEETVTHYAKKYE